jgi:uncharacterized protein (TIGR02246 family)
VAEEPESRAIEELIRAAYEALNRGDVDAFIALAHPDVEFTSLVAEAEATTFRGPAGIREWWDTVAQAFEGAHWELHEVRVLGPDRALVDMEMSGKLGGVDLSQRMWQAVVSRDDMPVWWGIYRTEQEALDALGDRGG